MGGVYRNLSDAMDMDRTNRTGTCQPALTILELLGGAPRVARELGIRARQTPARWTYPRPRGTGGMIPHKYWDSLQELAARDGKRLTREDFVRVSEVA